MMKFSMFFNMWRFSNLRSFLWIWYVFCRWRVSLNSRCNLMVLVDWCWCANLMKWFSCTACLWIKCWTAWNKEGKNSWVLYLTIYFRELILFLWYYTQSGISIRHPRLTKNLMNNAWKYCLKSLKSRVWSVRDLQIFLEQLSDIEWRPSLDTCSPGRQPRTEQT